MSKISPQIFKWIESFEVWPLKKMSSPLFVKEFEFVINWKISETAL